MQLPIQQIIDNFKEDFKKEDCPQFYNIESSILVNTIQDLEEYMTQTKDFMDLIYYIQNSQIFEIYINELIAPLVPDELVGENIEKQFLGSVGVYQRIAMQKQGNENAIVISSINVSASLIQNAYLYVCEIRDIDDLKDIAQTMELTDIYEHIINILCVPLKEVLKFRELVLECQVPHYIVSTFGLINADYAFTMGQEIIKRIEETFNQFMQGEMILEDSGQEMLN